MTETPPSELPKVEPAPAHQTHGHVWSWVAYGFALVLLGTLGVGGYYAYGIWQQQQDVISQLESRLTDLSGQLERVNTQVSQPAPVADFSAVTERMATMETEMANFAKAREAAAAAEQEQKAEAPAVVAPTTAPVAMPVQPPLPNEMVLRMNFSVLQRAAANNESFANETALFCLTAQTVSALQTPCNELTEWAARAVPTRAKLLTQITAMQDDVRKTLRHLDAKSMTDRLLASFADVISVRKLDAVPPENTHERTLFETVALTKRGDLVEALATAEKLPEDAQRDLASWLQGMRDRIALEDKLQTILLLITPQVAKDTGKQDKQP